MITVDKEQGIACDYGRIWRGDNPTDADECIITVGMEEGDVVTFTTGQGDLYVSIELPADRVRRLLCK